MKSVTDESAELAMPGQSIVWSSWPAEPPQLRPLELPRRLLVPLTPATAADPPAILPPGTIVSAGQRLTLTAPQASHAALAPVGGTVLGILPAGGRTTSGRLMACVELETDPAAARSAPTIALASATHGDAHPRLMKLLSELTPADLTTWLDRLRSAGVWADRRGSPDLTAQLHQALRRPIDTILCNVLDNDPAARLNAVLAARFRLELLAGVSLLARLTRANKSWVAIEAGAPPIWSKRLRHLASRSGAAVVPLRNDYPQSDPTMLLYALLDRRLRPGRLPVEQGVLLLDAAAAIAIGQVLLHQQPMLCVPVAIRDHVRHEAHFVACPVGMDLRDVLAQTAAGVRGTEGLILRCGDLLRDALIPTEAVVGGGELVLHLTPRAPAINPEPCIRCSWCVESCPVRIQPAGLLGAAQNNDLAMAEHYGIEACIECGVCSYVCPSRLPLLAAIRKLRHAG